MRIQNLLCGLLIFAVNAQSGWSHRSEAAPSDPPSKTSKEAGATSLVPIREPLTPLEVELGLDHEVSAKLMDKIATRVRKDGKPGIIGCGVAAGPDGKILGDLCGTHYSIKIPKSEHIYEVVVANLRIEKGWTLHALKVDGFLYRLQDGVFVRTKLPTKK